MRDSDIIEGELNFILITNNIMGIKNYNTTIMAEKSIDIITLRTSMNDTNEGFSKKFFLVALNGYGNRINCAGMPK